MIAVATVILRALDRVRERALGLLCSGTPFFFDEIVPPSMHAHAYCVLRTENIFVFWCCVGSDRVAGVDVGLGTLDLIPTVIRLFL